MLKDTCNRQITLSDFIGPCYVFLVVARNDPCCHALRYNKRRRISTYSNIRIVSPDTYISIFYDIRGIRIGFIDLRPTISTRLYISLRILNIRIGEGTALLDVVQFYVFYGYRHGFQILFRLENDLRKDVLEMKLHHAVIRTIHLFPGYAIHHIVVLMLHLYIIIRQIGIKFIQTFVVNSLEFICKFPFIMLIRPSDCRSRIYCVEIQHIHRPIVNFAQVRIIPFV